MACSISSARPTTGSIWSIRARSVRSCPYWSRVGVPRSGFGPVIGPRSALAACNDSGWIRPAASIRPAGDSGLSGSAIRMCSGPM